MLFLAKLLFIIHNADPWRVSCKDGIEVRGIIVSTAELLAQPFSWALAFLSSLDSEATVDGPLKCFNPSKNGKLGWYKDNSLEIDVGESWTGRLVAFVDYESADPTNNEFVLLRVGEFLFLQYNRAKGFNAGTSLHPDKVVVVVGEGGLVSFSVLRAGLGSGERYSWKGTTVEVCSLFFGASSLDYADVSVYPSGGVSTCMFASAQPSSTMTFPTSSPSTLRPTILPTSTPTSTIHPTAAAPSSPRSVLVVRILGDSGAEEPVETKARLAGAVFGMGNETLSNSMLAQFNRCSFGQLDFIPADGHPLISNGVMDVALSFTLEGRNVDTDRYLFHEETAALLGVNSLETAFDHVMFCVAAGTVFSFGSRSREWTALGLRETYSYFNSKFLRCDKLSALMHEMGHNLGLHHSGERDSQFGDTTGVVRTNAIGLPCPQIHSNVCPSCLRYRWGRGKEKFNFRPVVGSLTL